MAQNNQQKGQQKVQETSQLEKVRREKLAELQAAGKDPFQIVKYDQSYHSAQIKRDFDELEKRLIYSPATKKLYYCYNKTFILLSVDQQNRLDDIERRLAALEGA